MSAILNRSSLTSLSDGIISFLQYTFGNPENVPGEYRWNADEKATKVFISGPFTYSREKVGSLPTITVTRGPFSFENRTIDNRAAADTINFTNEEKQEILSGPITIICEAGAGDEAVALAQFVMLELQANRHNIKRHMTFLHRILWTGIMPEQPVAEQAEIKRWQCSVTFTTSIYTGWVIREQAAAKFNEISIKNANQKWESLYGATSIGSDLLVDNSADFGLLNTNNPQLLQSELTKGWYYVSFDGNKMYVVSEVVDSKTLRLLDNGVPYSAPSTASNVAYKLYWNTVNLDISLKN